MTDFTTTASKLSAKAFGLRQRTEPTEHWQLGAELRGKAVRRTWEKCRPTLSGEVARVAIRDLDGLFDTRVRSVNRTRMEGCRVHRLSPSGTSFYLPQSQWPAALSLQRAPNSLTSAPTPGASDGRFMGSIEGDGAAGLPGVSPPPRTVPGAAASENVPGAGRGEAARVPRASRSGGFCECCNTTFVGTVGQHCSSPNHTSFLADRADLAAFDALVSTLISGSTPFQVGHLGLTKASLPWDPFARGGPSRSHAQASTMANEKGHNSMAPSSPRGEDGASSPPNSPQPRPQPWPQPTFLIDGPAPHTGPGALNARPCKKLRSIPDSLDNSHEDRQRKKPRFVRPRSGYNPGLTVLHGRVATVSARGVSGSYSVLYQDGDEEEMSSDELYGIAAECKTEQKT